MSTQSYDNEVTQPPEGFGDCAKCLGSGDVCGECDLHEDACDCEILNPIAVDRGTAEPELPQLKDCGDCDGVGRVWA